MEVSPPLCLIHCGSNCVVCASCVVPAWLSNSCSSRESSPEQIDGNDVFYHRTTAALNCGDDQQSTDMLNFPFGWISVRETAMGSTYFRRGGQMCGWQTLAKHTMLQAHREQCGGEHNTPTPTKNTNIRPDVSSRKHCGVCVEE